MKKKVLFVKNGAVVMCRIQVHFVVLRIWKLISFDILLYCCIRASRAMKGYASSWFHRIIPESQIERNSLLMLV